MWQHVLCVAHHAEVIAKREGGDLDDVLCAAYLHDIAFAWLRKDDPACDVTSLRSARDILLAEGCDQEHARRIVDEIIAPHGMHDDRPISLEAKILSTADAMAHLTTHFYLELCWHRYLFEHSSFEQFRTWVLEKIERDYRRKIHFEPERKHVTSSYESLRRIFQKD